MRVQPLPIVPNPSLPRRHDRPATYAMPQGTLWAPRRDSEAGAAKVRLAHVDQGDLNDCFLAATMGALALKRPTLIAGMIRQRPGAVEVRLPSGTVTVDETLPLRKGTPLYTGSGTNRVLWPAYLEKAVAATRGRGYRTLDAGGEVRDAFQALTGVRPATTRQPQGDLLEDIARQLHDGHPVVVSTRRTRSDSVLGRALDRADLHGDHAYVATAVSNRGGERHLRLWNIWGVEHPHVLSEQDARTLLDEVVTDERRYDIVPVGRR